MTKDEIQYAIAKQLPATALELVIQTCYGDIVLTDDDALAVSSFVTALLERNLETEQ